MLTTIILNRNYPVVISNEICLWKTPKNSPLDYVYTPSDTKLDYCSVILHWLALPVLYLIQINHYLIVLLLHHHHHHKKVHSQSLNSHDHHHQPPSPFTFTNLQLSPPPLSLYTILWAFTREIDCSIWTQCPKQYTSVHVLLCWFLVPISYITLCSFWYQKTRKVVWRNSTFRIL